MLIIVEGCDNSGKSTLVGKLHEELDIPTIKPPSYNKIHKKGTEVAESYVRWLIDIFEQSKIRDFIMDRHPIISTPVYEPILFGKNDLLKNELWPELCLKFAKADPIIVYCRPSDDTIKNFGDRAQMDGVKDHADSLIWRYDAVMEQLKVSGFDMCYYDWTDDDGHGVKEMVAKFKWWSSFDVPSERVRCKYLTYFTYCYFPAKLSATVNDSVKVVEIISLKIKPEDITCSVVKRAWQGCYYVQGCAFNVR